MKFAPSHENVSIVFSQLALEIATEAHNGQFRSDKKTPYITHPIAVAEAVFKSFNNLGDVNPLFYFRYIAKGIAHVHDVVEDCEAYKGPGGNLRLTNDILGRMKVSGITVSLYFPYYNLIAEAINILNKNNYGSYRAYINACKDNVITRYIKIEDILHNMSTLDVEKNKTRYDKYSLALDVLMWDYKK